MKTKDLYFHGIPKKCSNCFYYAGWFTISRCNKYPTWASEDALKKCQFQDWQPNKKLYKKYGGLKNDTNRDN